MASVRQAPRFMNLYSTKAHVFQINPETKDSWLPKAKQAIPISFLASIKNENSTTGPTRRELKIVATDDAGETLLDDPISTKTSFTKRSQKFCQWIDHSGTLCGLGFDQDVELTKFMETFEHLQREILAPPSVQPKKNFPPVSTAGSQAAQQNDRLAWDQQPAGGPATETNGRPPAFKTTNLQQQYPNNPPSHPAPQQPMKRQQQQQPQPLQQPPTNSESPSISANGNGDLVLSRPNYPRSHSTPGIQGKTVNNNNLVACGKMTPDDLDCISDCQVKEQLKYENERLKQALEESSKNAGIWQNELINLRTNNLKLTQALEESRSHVGEWARELANLRDENNELKSKLTAFEGALDESKKYEKDLKDYKNYIEEMQLKSRKKDEDIEILQNKIDELAINKKSDDQRNSSALSAQHKQELDIISARLGAKLDDVKGVYHELTQFTDKINQ